MTPNAEKFLADRARVGKAISNYEDRDLPVPVRLYRDWEQLNDLYVGELAHEKAEKERHSTSNS